MSQEQESRQTARQNELSQEGSEPKQTDVERVEGAAQSIVEAIEAGSDRFWEAQVEATKPKNPLTASMLFVTSTWVVFFALITATTLLIGWAVYGVEPWHSIKRIADEQQRYDQEKALHEHQLRQNERAAAQMQAEQKLGGYYSELGNSLLNAGQPEAAKAEFDKALDIDPLNTEAREGSLKAKLFVTIEKQDYDPAVMQQRLFELQEEYPKDSHLASFAGDVFSFYDPKTALDEYQKAIDLNKSNAMAHYGMALVYYEQGKYEKSLTHFETAYDLANWNPNYQYAFAQVLYELKRYDKAIYELWDLTWWDPLFMWSYADLTHVYRLDGQIENSHWAGGMFIKLLEDKEVASLKRNRGPFLFSTGPDSATVALTEDPEKKYYAYYNMALTSHLMGNTEEAKDYISQAEALQLDPSVKSEVERLLNYNINRLKEEQNFDAKAEDFRAEFL